MYIITNIYAVVSITKLYERECALFELKRCICFVKNYNCVVRYYETRINQMKLSETRARCYHLDAILCFFNKLLIIVIVHVSYR